MSTVGPHKTPTSIAPWLSVRDAARAIAFYQAAFAAAEVYHLDAPDGSVVARLSVDGAEFWVSGESPAPEHAPASGSDQSNVRVILTVPDPDALFAQALASGATEVYPVSEGHGWRIGRIVDPDGHHWEIGRPLE